MRPGLDHFVYGDHIMMPSPEQISPLAPFKSVLKFQPFALESKTKNAMSSNIRRPYHWINIATVIFDEQGSMRGGMGLTMLPKPSEKWWLVYVDTCELVGILRQILRFTKPIKAFIVNEYVFELSQASKAVDRWGDRQKIRSNPFCRGLFVLVKSCTYAMSKVWTRKRSILLQETLHCPCNGLHKRVVASDCWCDVCWSPLYSTWCGPNFASFARVTARILHNFQSSYDEPIAGLVWHLIGQIDRTCTEESHGLGKCRARTFANRQTRPRSWAMNSLLLCWSICKLSHNTLLWLSLSCTLFLYLFKNT